jgi:hypothetical protein
MNALDRLRTFIALSAKEHTTGSNKMLQSAAQHVSSIENSKEKQLVSNHFAKFFSGHNPKFDHDRWHKAAGTAPSKDRKMTAAEQRKSGAEDAAFDGTKAASK